MGRKKTHLTGLGSCCCPFDPEKLYLREDVGLQYIILIKSTISRLLVKDKLVTDALFHDSGNRIRQMPGFAESVHGLPAYLQCSISFSWSVIICAAAAGLGILLLVKSEDLCAQPMH